MCNVHITCLHGFWPSMQGPSNNNNHQSICKKIPREREKSEIAKLPIESSESPFAATHVIVTHAGGAAAAYALQPRIMRRSHTVTQSHHRSTYRYSCSACNRNNDENLSAAPAAPCGERRPGLPDENTCDIIPNSFPLNCIGRCCISRCSCR